MTETGSTSMNRLSQAVSPYLLAHAHQSVEWYPWGEEAFAEAARRDVPVLISIGYRTCHWCHVMSRESFDDPATAELLNEHVVSIKVDREEHLDVDATYLAQAAAFTRNLGWPLTVFATPQGQAFYAATYLPPAAREGLPSFSDVIHAASKAWKNNRSEVLESSSALVEALAAANDTLHDTSHPVVTPEDLSAVVGQLRQTEDPEHGGFGRAPKFPLAPVLNFLWGRGSLGDEDASALAQRVLKQYTESDLWDLVEGGFFRYSTQADFSDPHYERMLYDNAGLLMAYSRQRMPNVAGKIVGFLSSQLGVGEGLGTAFASGQDSESTCLQRRRLLPSRRGGSSAVRTSRARRQNRDGLEWPSTRGAGPRSPGRSGGRTGAFRCPHRYLVARSSCSSRWLTYPSVPQRHPQ
jgi:uncharacterized protein YyaL (SSP411 family)